MPNMENELAKDPNTLRAELDKNVADYHETILINGVLFWQSDCNPICDLCDQLEQEENGRQEIATAKIIEGYWS